MENQPNQASQPTPAGPDNKDVNNGKAMAILSYLTFLVLIPYFTEKNNKFVRFHAIQGMNLLLVWVAYIIINIVVSAIVTSVAYSNCVSSYYGYYGSCATGFGAAGIVSLIFGIIAILIAILAILGIVNAATGKMKELPIIGKIKIIKK